METIVVKAEMSQPSADSIRNMLRVVDSEGLVPDRLRVMARIACINLNLQPVTTNMHASAYARHKKADTLRHSLETSIVPKRLTNIELMDPGVRLTRNGLITVTAQPTEELDELRKEIAEAYASIMGDSIIPDDLGDVEALLPGDVIRPLTTVMNTRIGKPTLHVAGAAQIAIAVKSGVEKLDSQGDTLSVEGATRVERSKKTE